MLNTEKSRSLYQKAQHYLVGGVNSPVRAFRSVGGTPLFIDHGEKSRITDVDGNEYVDYVGSYGPLILGHNNPVITEALTQALSDGISFGASTEKEIVLAQLINEAFPSIELVRFVNSGTEAVMSAIRLARAYTGKFKIIKFAGCYHGHSDFLLAQAGSGLATLSLPGSAGVPENTVADTIIAPFNDIEYVENLFEIWSGQIAAVIIEPVPGNMGVVLPENNFLRQLRDLTYKNESLLIMDEVMSGFRQHFGGAQQYFGVEGDLTCLGKIIGGGLPVGAYGGRRDIMSLIAPLGPVYQAGTLSGNPLSMAAGIAALTYLKENDVYTRINSYTTRLAAGLISLAEEINLPLQLSVFGSMFTPFLNKEKVIDYTTAKKSDTVKFAAMFWKLLENGVFPPPSQFEAWFVSSSMDDEDLQMTLRAFEKAFQEIA
jgi:glutamate-1-semialdehyde 2,1-aminomutase